MTFSVADVDMRPQFGSLARSTTTALIVFCLVGCGPQDDAPKASHFEHDHIVAAHWPSDLADAAVKIRERLVWIDTGEAPEHHAEDDDDHHDHDDHHDEHDQKHDPVTEIFDLVSWVPEVAADTNLSEADWLPLYHAAESLMVNLRAANEGLSSENRSQLESFCELIEETSEKIPELIANLQVTSP